MYLHEWLIFMVNVGKYTSPMDSMGNAISHLAPANEQNKPDKPTTIYSPETLRP